MKEFRVAIDGGGTHCRGRLLDRQNNILAEYVGGSANVYSHYERAINEVEKVIVELFQRAELSKRDYAHSILVAGLAGANVPSVKQRLESWGIAELQHKIVSDVEIACIGAHQGKPGAVLICGTGSQGVAWDGQHFHAIGGWGFMLSDLASGAVLGQKALRMALLAHEGMLPPSALTQYLMGLFNNDPEKMLLWTQQAQPKDWASYAKPVFKYAQLADCHAKTLVKQCATEAEMMLETLISISDNKVSMLGGLAEPLLSWLSPEIKKRLVQPKGNALDGAQQLAHHYS